MNAEEEKLRISKAFIDLQIENNKIVENSETRNHELVDKLIIAENRVLELEMKANEEEKISRELQAELQEQNVESQDVILMRPTDDLTVSVTDRAENLPNKLRRGYKAA